MATIRTKRSPGKSSGVKPKKPLYYQPGDVNPNLNIPGWGGYSGDDMYDPSALPDYRYQPWYPQAFPNANIPANAYWLPQTGEPGLQQPVTAQPATGQPSQPIPEWNPQSDPYAWRRDASGNLVDGMYPASALPEGWTSTYSPEAYMWNPELGIYGKFSQRQQPLTAIWGGSNKGTMGTRGWRRPKSTYFPEQQIKMDSEGNVWAERPEWDRRSRMQKFLDKINEKPAGNNRNVSISGAPVSWRT